MNTFKKQMATHLSERKAGDRKRTSEPGAGLPHSA
jgi:hypothetical protein